jgi:hypothetical protein
MAEIHVEKKNRPVWPWIVGILLIAAVIWIVADNDDDITEADTVGTAQTEEQDAMDNTMENNDNAMMENNQQNDAMAYVSFIEENGENVTIEHDYSHQALTHLAAALNSMAGDASEETKQKLNDLKQKADNLTQNPMSEQHANMMVDAFNSAAMVMESMQQEMFPDLGDEVQQVKDAANGIDPSVIVTEQKDAVKKFFETSADAVEAMAENQNA